MSGSASAYKQVCIHRYIHNYVGLCICLHTCVYICSLLTYVHICKYTNILGVLSNYVNSGILFLSGSTIPWLTTNYVYYCIVIMSAIIASCWLQEIRMIDWLNTIRQCLYNYSCNLFP